MKKTLLILLAGLLLPSSTALIQAQEGRGSGHLTCTVVDETGKTVEGASILLNYINANRSLQTTTNKKGQFGFLGLGKGLIKITTKKEGYIPNESQMQISGVSNNPEARLVLQKIPTAAQDSSDESRDTFARANSLFEKMQYEQALNLYRELAQKNPVLYKIGIYIGNCLSELREYDQALAEYQKVLDIVAKETPDLKGSVTAAQAYAGIGDIYLRQEKYKEAEVNFRKSIEIQPADPALAYNIAEIMFAQNKVDEAEKYYLLAVQIKPEWPKSYLKLAYVSLNKGLIDKAVEYLKKFCEIGKDDPKYAEGQALLEILQKK